MTAPAPPRDGFDVLDQLITEALVELRSARITSRHEGGSRNRDVQARAEEHLNALLEYRYAAQRR
ncbi:hypothetical protein ACI78T_02830 [Blastococcus sp. SYSU D00922]